MPNLHRTVQTANLITVALWFALSAGVFGGAQAATLSNGLGLEIDTFPASITGPSFTDAEGNVLTVPQAAFVSGNAWLGAGDLTATFVSPVTAVGFTFLNICANCSSNILIFTLINGVTLNNGDSYTIPTGIASGAAAPQSQFFGVVSATTFTSATFFSDSEFAISDFRFGDTEVPEPTTVEVVAPTLLAIRSLMVQRHRRRELPFDADSKTALRALWQKYATLERLEDRRVDCPDDRT